LRFIECDARKKTGPKTRDFGEATGNADPAKATGEVRKKTRRNWRMQASVGKVTAQNKDP